MIRLSWNEPFDDPIAYLNASDIPRAIEFFGSGLTALHLNPMYLRKEINGKRNPMYLDVTFPENIEVLEHAGCAGWEIMGDVKEDKNTVMVGQKIETPENSPAPPVLKAVSTQQVAEDVNRAYSRGRMTPTASDMPPEIDCSASKKGLSLETDHILTKRGFQPSNRKIYPKQNEVLF